MTESKPCSTVFDVDEYDLEATLDSGQAFRWERLGEGGEGIVGGRWVRLEARRDGRIGASTVVDAGDWGWLRNYLALDVDPRVIASTFPPDPPLLEAVRACRGLRVLRQEPWECLASFILSSTKQIVQIRQIVGEICRRFGPRVKVPIGHPEAWGFPGARVIAGLEESGLRACRMGFRAKYLLGSARAVVAGPLDLEGLRNLPLGEAREALMELPGVGPKIADCALLFSCGFDQAFPVDVWILRTLRELYFPRRDPGRDRLLDFAGKHFGPYGGHAQQYLFHHARLRAGRVASVRGDGAGSVRDGD